MSNIEALRSKARAAQVALHAAEAKQRDIEHVGLIGKCFKYRNSSSGDREKWWLYMRVTKAEDGQILGTQFQLIPGYYGGAEVRVEHNHYQGSRLLDGFKEISYMEFSEAWQDILAHVEKIAPLDDH